VADQFLPFQFVAPANIITTSKGRIAANYFLIPRVTVGDSVQFSIHPPVTQSSTAHWE